MKDNWVSVLSILHFLELKVYIIYKKQHITRVNWTVPQGIIEKEDVYSSKGSYVSKSQVYGKQGWMSCDAVGAVG